MLRFDNRVWLLWAAWILLLPLKWLLAAAAAVCVHEAFHIAAVLLVGGRIRYVLVMPFGAVIEAEGISGLRELVCALSGPVGSFLLLIGIHRFPLLGLCGLVQGMFNLLPVYPLDGGRALARILECVVPDHAESIIVWVEGTILFLFFTGAVFVAVRYSFGFFPILFCILVTIYARLRKRP